MAGPGRLAAVPEESTNGSASPPLGLYGDWIRTVAVSGTQRRSTILCQSGSSYSSASTSYLSNNSSYSSGLASAAGRLEYFGGQQELKRIARGMVGDGYTQRMVQAFHDASSAPAMLVFVNDIIQVNR